MCTVLQPYYYAYEFHTWLQWITDFFALTPVHFIFHTYCTYILLKDTPIITTLIEIIEGDLAQKFFFKSQ